MDYVKSNEPLKDPKFKKRYFFYKAIFILHPGNFTLNLDQSVFLGDKDILTFWIKLALSFFFACPPVRRT